MFEHIEYTPYGELWEEQKSDVFDRIPFRFSGKFLDTETALYYVGARYMDPRTSRWISSDPSGMNLINPMENPSLLISGQNWYSYTENNPVKYTDPTGEFPFIPVLLLGAAVFTLLKGSPMSTSHAPDPGALDSASTQQLTNQFSGKFGNPYARQGNGIDNANRRPFYPPTNTKSDYPLAARIIDGLFPVGVDDSMGSAQGHSMADAVQGGKGQVDLTVYTDRKKNFVTGFEMKVFAQDPRKIGPAGAQPDFEWRDIIDPGMASMILKDNPELMKNALIKALNNEALDKMRDE